MFFIKMISRTWTTNSLTKLTLPPKTRLKCTSTYSHISWQELKEALAHAISHHCFSPQNLHCLHAQVISSGLHQNLYLSSLLITKYFHFQDTENPARIFSCLKDRRPTKTLLWNSLIKGYLKAGLPYLALTVYKEMVGPSSDCEPDKQTLHLAITACTQLSEFEMGFQIRHCVKIKGLESDLLIATALVNMFAKMGDMKTARRLFDGMASRDVVSWNAMISRYSQAGFLDEAMNLLKEMRIIDGILPTEASLVSVISCCGDLCLVWSGKVVHAHVIKIGYEGNLFVSNSLLAMYVACNRLEMAVELFKTMAIKDAISWSTIINGYVEHGRPYDALELFHWMVSNTGILPTRPILLSVLLACGDLGDWQQGKWIEEKYLRNESGGLISDAKVITALICMYARSGKMEISLGLLENVTLVSEDVIAWNAMIKACEEHGRVDWVWELVLRMQRRGISPDPATFLLLLSLISSIPFPRKGMETHCHIMKRGFQSERTIANSLIDMYGKFGSISDSYKVFDGIQEKDVVSWSSMINAYAWNGNAIEALDLFQLMRTTEIRPNHFTFLAILSACSQAGFVEKGRELFESMEKEHGIELGTEHFGCMLDIFCRAGLLKDAYDLLQKGMQKACTSPVLWGTLLSACRMHGDQVIGEAAARHLFLLEPGNAANYLMLADIYKLAGRRDDSNCVLGLLRAKGLEKKAGCSWLEG